MKTHALLLVSTLAALGGCHSPRPTPHAASASAASLPAGTLGSTLPNSPAAASAPAPTSPTTTAGSAGAWSFDADAAGAPPRGFVFGRTGSGDAGRWLVQAARDAPSKPNIVAQLDTDDTDYRFPIAVAAEPSLRDERVSVRCKMVSGKVDQGCGLVARYRDESNYYVTRANALEDNIRLYIVKDGKRKQLASWSGKVTPNVWHEYRFEVRGDHLEAWWDGQKLLEHSDSTLAEAGKAGVWTKADSVTWFDDLKIEAL